MNATQGAPPPGDDVLLAGARLPQRWQGRERFVMLATGFGSGQHFLATWNAWRADPLRCAKLVFIAVEPRPLQHADLLAAHRETPFRDLADALLAAWPPLTPNLHWLSLDTGCVELLLMIATVPQALPELVASVDAFVLDGAGSAPSPHAWDPRGCKALGRLAAPGATLAAQSVAPSLHAGLTAAGFSVQRAALDGTAPGVTPEITRATFAPSYTPRRAPARGAAPQVQTRRALIVGGGLAGCATAWALAEHGWHSSVLERHPTIACEGSGNPAGLFHGIVNAQDGRHARFNRAAALDARAAAQIAIERHGVSGNARGLLRIESVLDPAAMQAMLSRLGLPPGYVQAVDAKAASALAGMALVRPAWFYPGGGWVHPGGLARAFLERAGGRASLRTGVAVHALARTASGWQLLDAQGASIDEAEVVVLANAGDALRFLGDTVLPMQRVRGQISILPAADLPLPQMPIAGPGYLLPALDGRAMFGATAQPDDEDGSVRAADHAENIAQLERLIGARLDVDPERLAGRTAWRWVTADRLPVIGAVPDPAEPIAAAARLDQPRFVPRLPGLFVFSALGSRGVTWCALGGRVVASAVSGAPAPVEASLLDAVDPARFVARRVRRADLA